MPSAPDPAVEAKRRQWAADSNLLRVAWDERFSYGQGRKEFAALHGVGRAFVGHCLNGAVGISDLWKLRFASFLSVPPRAIWPDFELERALVEALDPPLQQLLSAALAARPKAIEAATELLREARAS